jgi:hypothetical protein
MLIGVVDFFSGKTVTVKAKRASSPTLTFSLSNVARLSLSYSAAPRRCCFRDVETI